MKTRAMQILDRAGIPTPRDLIQATQATVAPIADPIGASGSPKRKRHDG